MSEVEAVLPHLLSPLERARTLRTELKTALYGAVERVQATKAALYLATQYSADSPYELVTSYGFAAGDRARIDHKDPVVARLEATHAPLVVNDLELDTLAAEVLFRQHHSRLLAMPIFGRGRRLVGIVDLRDKAKNRPFEDGDIAAAESVCSDIRHILSANDLYGVGPVPIVQPQASSTGSNPRLAIRHREIAEPPPADSPVTTSAVSAQALDAIRNARARMQKRRMETESRRRFVTTDEAARLALLLPAALAIPTSVVAALTVTNGQWLAATGPVSEDALAVLRPKNLPGVRPQVNVVGIGAPVCASRLCRIATVPLAPNVVDQVTLTVALEQEPDDLARQRFNAFVDVFGTTVAATVGHSAWDTQREAVAERLLEPDLQKFPALADHSHMVSGIAQRFAIALGLPRNTVETIRLAGIVHDVGLRILDYDRLVGPVHLTPEHRKAVQEHPLVGASIVSPLLGPEIAEAVLHHHERWDGQGYPGRLAGAKIPLNARILGIAEAWASMRAPWAYAPGTRVKDAVGGLRKDSGTQFDPSLVGQFLAALQEIDP